ncbi:MAG: hypothetical protein IT428_23945 [Planctomycetaceae bacterium]|nr:hypothetical protein [Planctomycetaceae bacterium]
MAANVSAGDVVSERGVRFARRVFTAAGIYGLLVLPPMLFLETRIGIETPPPITHSEFFYGFLGVAIAWQFAFVVIGRDPIRYRPLMPATWVEKFSYGVATVVLFQQGRIPPAVLAFGLLDSVLGVLFVASWWWTRERR